MQESVALGSVFPLGKAWFPQFAPFRSIKVPRQEWLDILGNLATGHRALLEVPRPPFPWIELPEGQRGQDREHRRRLLAAPERTRAVEVLPRHRRTAGASFRGVIVQRNPGVVHEPRPPFPMLLQALQCL